MFCPNCRSQIWDESKGCDACGWSQTGNSNNIENNKPFRNIISKNDFIGWIIKLAAIAVVYGIINLFLIGGQTLWHKGDQAKLDQLKNELEAQRPSIEKKSSELTTLSNELTRIEAELDMTQNIINGIEAKYPNGLPNHLYNDYSQAINDYNTAVENYNLDLSNYKRLYQQYSQSISQYNKKVNEANQLAKDIGTTWYLVPVPLHGHGAIK